MVLGPVLDLRGLNLLRVMLDRTVALPDTFELSATYLFFYHKLEAANTALQRMSARPDLRESDREFRYIMRSAVEDGGDWGLFCGLVEKYGVVPHSAYGDVAANDDSETLNQVLASVLVEGVHAMRRGSREAHAWCLRRVYRVLCRALGEPPTTFKWRIGRGDVRANVNVLPLDLTRDVLGFHPREFCVLVDDGRFTRGTRCRHVAGMGHEAAPARGRGDARAAGVVRRVAVGRRAGVVRGGHHEVLRRAERYTRQTGLVARGDAGRRPLRAAEDGTHGLPKQRTEPRGAHDGVQRGRGLLPA